MTTEIDAARVVVDGLMQVNRALGLISENLLDIGTALIVVNVKAGPQGDAQTNAALNAVHAAQDEIQGAQRQLLRMLEASRSRVETVAAVTT